MPIQDTGGDRWRLGDCLRPADGRLWANLKVERPTRCHCPNALALDVSSLDVSLGELVKVGDWVFVKVIKRKCWSQSGKHGFIYRTARSSRWIKQLTWIYNTTRSSISSIGRDLHHRLGVQIFWEVPKSGSDWWLMPATSTTLAGPVLCRSCCFGSSNHLPRGAATYGP